MPTYSAWQATITDAQGNALSGATVEVRIESSGTLATIYSTRTGTAASNPLTADSSGFVQFFAAAGTYRIIATSGSSTTTWNYVSLGTVSEYDRDGITDEFFFDGGISFDDGTNTLDSLVNWTAWTPTITGSSTAGTPVYTTQAGRYQVINNMAFVQGIITINGAISATGEIRLPLPITPSASGQSKVPITIGDYSNISITSGNTFMGFMQRSIGQIRLYQGSNTTTSALSNGNFSSDFTITYAVNFEV